MFHVKRGKATDVMWKRILAVLALIFAVLELLGVGIAGLPLLALAVLFLAIVVAV